MYEVLPNTDVPASETSVRRYMSIAKLVSLLTESCLYFAPLSSLEDPREGSMTVADDALRQVVRDLTRVSCWHSEDIESDALWRLYALKEETVAVRSDVGRLKEAFDVCDKKIAIARVRYVGPGYRAPAEQLPGPLYPYMYKRECFAHEREIRAVVIPSITSEELEARRFASMSVSELLRVQESGGFPNAVVTTPARGESVQVNLDRLIREVIISPYASEWLRTSISALIRTFGLEAPVRFSRLRFT